MDALVLFLVVLNAAQLAWLFRRQRHLGAWLLPSTAWAVIGFLNYPARALILTAVPSWNEYGLEAGEIALALAFYTVFTTILLMVFLAATARFEVVQPEEAQWRSGGALTVLFLLLAVSFAYRLYTGRNVYALYESMEDLRIATVDNLWSVPLNLKWLVIPWAWLAWVRTRSRRFLVIGILSVAMVMVLAVITTGKSDLLSLVILYLAGSAYLRRPPSRLVVAAGMAIGLVFGVYSYLARSHADVRGEFSVERVTAAMDAVGSNADAGSDAAIRSLVSRFSYLDGLALCSRGTRLPAGPFVAGSISEALMLVPRSLWPGRPFLSFNHYMTEAVWGMPVFSETPIGRAGEAYFVLGMAGVLGGALYGGLWGALVRGLLGRPSRWRHVLYFLVFFLFLLPDGYLTYGIKPLVYVTPLLVLAWQVDRAEHRWWRLHHLWQRRLQQ